MNISLTPKLEEMVKAKVASGLYNNASEVVSEALRLMAVRDLRDTPSTTPPSNRSASNSHVSASD